MACTGIRDTFRGQSAVMYTHTNIMGKINAWEFWLLNTDPYSKWELRHLKSSAMTISSTASSGKSKKITNDNILKMIYHINLKFYILKIITVGLGTNFIEIWVTLLNFPFQILYLKMLPGKCQPPCSGPKVLSFGWWTWIDKVYDPRCGTIRYNMIECVPLKRFRSNFKFD